MSNPSETEFRSLSDEDRAKVLEQDRQLAKDLGLEQPYALPEMFGTCPGSAGYGHGLTYTSVHRECCQAWNERRELRQMADKEAAG